MKIYANPFYFNYIFSEFDLERVKIKWFKYPFLWLLPTYVQINDGYVYHFKLWNGKIFFMSGEKLNIKDR